MELIGQIINELMDGEKPINSPLLKTKVLASRLKNEALLRWTTNELRGYNNENEVPNYRKYTGIVECEGQIGLSHKMSHFPVPIHYLDDNFRSIMETHVFYESVTTLEAMVTGESQGLYVPFSTEIIAYVQQVWQKYLQSGTLGLYSIQRTVSRNAIVQLLSTVRNDLLDFMLKIDEEFGNITQIEELRTKNQQVTYIMNQTINTSGNQNVINTGNDVNISTNNTISTGDKNDLLKYLKEIGVEKEDALELVSILEEEEPNKDAGDFGGKVNNWIAKMVTKASSGAWSVSVSAAGNLLATGIKAYYGWH